MPHPTFIHLPSLILQVYYVPTTNPDPYPPNITSYIDSIQSTIGAQTTWQESNVNVYNNFATTGDWMRTSKPDLENVINSGVRTLIFDGDADYIVNFVGVEAMVCFLFNFPPFIRAVDPDMYVYFWGMH